MENDSAQSSPIKLIHEIARRNKMQLEYKLENESGPAHAKNFTMRLRFGEKEYLGVDRSIKAAQRAAARLALEDQRELVGKMNEQENQSEKTSSSSTVLLNTWAAQHHIPTQYVLIHEENLPSVYPNHQKRPRQIFYYRLFIGQDLFFDGHGFSRPQARQCCAFHALNYLREHPIIIPIASTQAATKSSVSLMYERARHLGLPVQIENPEPCTIIYRIGENYQSMATGSTKQIAKTLAAEKMLEWLPETEEKPAGKSKSKRTHQHRKFVEQRGSLDYATSHEINPITRVYQIGQARHLKVEFVELEKLPNDKRFHFQVRFDDQHHGEGFGSSKQAAKRAAAEHLLSELNPDVLQSGLSSNVIPSTPTLPIKSLLKRDENANKSHEKKHVHFRDDEIVQTEKSDDYSPSFTIKQQLIKACQKLNIQVEFEDEPKENDHGQAQSILSLSIDGRLLAKFRGQAPSIKRAQENASTAAWTNLKELFNGSVSTPKTNGTRPLHPSETTTSSKSEN